MLGKDGLFAVQDENAFRTARDGRRRSGASRFPEAFFRKSGVSRSASFFSCEKAQGRAFSPCRRSRRKAACAPYQISGRIMKDERGLYYFPQAGNHEARVYVRRGELGEIEFRLWQAHHPEVWEKHGWIPLSVIENAARLYRAERNPEADPLKLYDVAVAQVLLREDRA